MNRRNFIGNILAAGAAFSILPGAGRLWKKKEQLWIPNPDYVDAPLEFAVIGLQSTVYDDIRVINRNVYRYIPW